MLNLQFKKYPGHLNHLDNWNHFTEDGQVGEYPEEIGKEKLADFPNNFVEYKQPEPPKKVAAKPVLINVPKKPTQEPTKQMKSEGTETKG